MNSKSLVVIALVCCIQVLCAPQPRPVDWRQFGSRVLAFGKQALPVVKSGCQLLNGQPQYMQYPQYPQYPPGQYQQELYENNYY